MTDALPFPPISTAMEAVAALRGGDRIFLTFLEAGEARLWKLVHGRREVPERIVDALRQGGRYGRRRGRLEGQGDALWPGAEPQTWRWVEG